MVRREASWCFCDRHGFEPSHRWPLFPVGSLLPKVSHISGVNKPANDLYSYFDNGYVLGKSCSTVIRMQDMRRWVNSWSLFNEKTVGAGFPSKSISVHQLEFMDVIGCMFGKIRLLSKMICFMYFWLFIDQKQFGKVNNGPQPCLL